MRLAIPAATSSAIAICLVVFALEVSLFGSTPTADQLRKLGAINVADLAQPGEWWRIVASSFLHAFPWHLAANVVGFWFMAATVESLTGPRQMFLLLGTAMIASAVLGVLLGASDDVQVGASGLLAGAVGYGLAIEPIPKEKIGWMAWSFLVVNLALPFIEPGLSHGAHLGGLAAGLAFGLVFRPVKAV